MTTGTLSILFVVVLVAVLLVLWLRGRRLGMGGPGGLVGRIDLTRGFPRTRGKGYSGIDVEDVLDRAYGLATSEDGRARALELLHEAQFGLTRRGGYDAIVVDMHVDAMVVALQTGRALPPRPGVPRA